MWPNLQATLLTMAGQVGSQPNPRTCPAYPDDVDITVLNNNNTKNPDLHRIQSNLSPTSATASIGQVNINGPAFGKQGSSMIASVTPYGGSYSRSYSRDKQTIKLAVSL